MKKYIIVGSNNFWYDSFSAGSVEEAKKRMEEIKDNPTDYNVAQPDTFYLYEADQVCSIEND